MITKTQYGLSPTLTVTINGAPVDYHALNEVEMYLEHDLHDMLILRMSGIPARAMSDYRNRPVFCSLELGSGYSQEFAGYVIDVRATAIASAGVLNGNPFQDAHIICMGTSYEMRGGNTRVWPGHTIQDVVAELSDTYGFSFDVPEDSLVLANQIQSGESDWQFLTDYATALGFETTLHGTHLHVFDPYQAYSRRTSYHVLRTSQQVHAGTAPYPGQITDINVTMAERHPDGVYKDTVIAVHQDNNVVYDVSLSDLRGLTAPARFVDRLSDSALTHDQAVRAIEARGKKSYDYYADLTVMGLPGCKPGGVVSIDSYGAANTDGLWYVRSVRHRLHSGVFLTDLKIARNINSELVPNPVHSMQPPPAPKLVNGRWVPTKRVLNVYT